MERLSSTTRMGRFLSGECVFMGGRGWLERQIQSEGGAAAGAPAQDGECAADLLGREGAVVQAEAMAGLLGGKPLVEDPVEVLRGDAYTVVADGDFDAAVVARRAHRDLLVGPS